MKPAQGPDLRHPRAEGRFRRRSRWSVTGLAHLRSERHVPVDAGRPACAGVESQAVRHGHGSTRFGSCPTCGLVRIGRPAVALPPPARNTVLPAAWSCHHPYRPKGSPKLRRTSMGALHPPTTPLDCPHLPANGDLRVLQDMARPVVGLRQVQVRLRKVPTPWTPSRTSAPPTSKTSKKDPSPPKCIACLPPGVRALPVSAVPHVFAA